MQLADDQSNVNTLLLFLLLFIIYYLLENSQMLFCDCRLIAVDCFMVLISGATKSIDGSHQWYSWHRKRNHETINCNWPYFWWQYKLVRRLTSIEIALWLRCCILTATIVRSSVKNSEFSLALPFLFFYLQTSVHLNRMLWACLVVGLHSQVM